MRKTFYKSIAVMILSLILLTNLVGCGNETSSNTSSSTASDTIKLSNEEFAGQYADILAIYNKNAVSFTETNELSYKRYKTTVRSSISTNVGVIYGEDGAIDDMRVDTTRVEGNEVATASMAYKDGIIYNEIVKSDVNKQRYSSKEKQEDVMEFLFEEMKVSCFKENIDISKFSSVYKENVTENGYSIVIAEPSAEYLTQLYSIFKNSIESKLKEQSKITSFKGVFGFDAEGKFVNREFVFTAVQSENESVTVKNILTLNKTKDEVTFDSIQFLHLYKEVNSVIDLYHLNDVLKNVQLKNGTVSGEESIAFTGLIDISQKTKSKIEYSTLNDKLSFDIENDVTQKIEVLKYKETRTDTESYKDGEYKGYVEKMRTNKKMTEFEAQKKLNEACIIVPFDVTDIVSVSCTQNDNEQKYTYTVGEETLKRYVSTLLEIEGVEEGFGISANDIELKVNQKKSKAEVTVKNGKLTDINCVFVAQYKENYKQLNMDFDYDITIKQTRTFTEKQ